MEQAAQAGGDGERLAHLAGPASAVRQAIAAHFLTGCAHVVEIGGAGLPMSRFLTHRPLSVTVIDPKIAPHAAEMLDGAPCRVRHVAAKFQDRAQIAEAMPELAPDSYGLVMLGLSLKPFGGHAALDEGLLSLVRGARVVVIDYALQLERAAAQIPILLKQSRHDIVADMEMRLNDARLAQTPFGDRRLIVLSSRSGGGA